MTISKGMKTTTYYLGQEFNVDVVETPLDYEAWIYHVAYGIKVMMFGIDKTKKTMNSFLEIVERNVPEYITEYEEEYCK